MATDVKKVPKEITEHAIRDGRGIMKGFSAFIRQYGVAPLAIGVVLANAVNDLVKSLVDGIITPFISLVSPSTSLQTLELHLGKSIFKIGLVLNAFLSFVVIALVVYLFAKIVLRDEEVLKKK